MKPKTALLILTVFTIVTSCKKDKLEGDKSILIGEWEWSFTKRLVDYCDPDYQYTDTLTPITEQTSFQILFFEKGKVKFFNDKNEISHHRITFSDFGDTVWDLPGYVSYSIRLDGSIKEVLEGYVKEDSLVVIRDFPYPDKDAFEPGVDCYLTTSYFVRK